VTYTVNISNTSNFGDITVDQVCDTAYGTIYRSATAPSALGACAAGSVSGLVTGGTNSTTCDSSTLGDISTSGSCTFVVTQAENVKVFDTVSVTGRGLTAGAFGPSNSNAVEVDSNEATATGTLTKALSGTTAGCVTARYSVHVKNTSNTTAGGVTD